MTLAMATFAPKKTPDNKVEVQFNPASLKLTVANTIADKSGNAYQTSAKSAEKLDLELIFDSTEDGGDVRDQSNRLKTLGFVPDSNKFLPSVVFAWGVFSFVGAIESFNETFDFFSAKGAPLRVTVQLSMKALKLEAIKLAGQSGDPPALNPKIAAPPANGLGATGLAQSAGDPRAGRALAAANGLESMRFPGAASMSLGAGDAALKGPAGLSASAALPAEMSVGLSFGASASAGVSASLGAFAGLGDSKISQTILKPNLAAQAPGFDPPASGAARFDLTGKLVSGAAASPRADARFAVGQA